MPLSITTHRLRLVAVAVIAACLIESLARLGGAIASVIVIASAAALFVWSGKARHGQEMFPLSWRWSWTVLIPFIQIAENCIFVCKAGRFDIFPHISLVLFLYGIAVGLIEECSLRGYAFMRAEQESPMAVVMLSTLGFSLGHLAGLMFDRPAGTAVLLAITAIPSGIVWGTMRLATRGICWPALTHSFLDASGLLATVFRPHHSTAGRSAILFGLSNLVLPLLLLLFHPALRRKRIAAEALIHQA
ncbi:MAG TPA: CPBP family intramembrane glutamic endopeptidase [Chthoniobacterales bacterium]|jgi:membrane protease YdiL (CAAX protease family)